MMSLKKTLVLSLSILTLSLVAPSAEAGGRWWRRQATSCGGGYAGVPVHYQGCGAAAMVPVQAAPVQAQAAPVVAAQPETGSGGAAGFLAWLNATRASYGVAPVAYDPAIEASCAQNNALQAAHGLGHHFMGLCRRQNSAAGLFFPGVEAAWMASPGHSSALLDPSLTRIGIAWLGHWCTFGGY